MHVYLKRKGSGICATGEYNAITNQLIVLSESIVTDRIACSETFRGLKVVEKLRKENVHCRVVIKDVVFNSPSTAANFVTGYSTNGLTAWRDETGKMLKEFVVYKIAHNEKKND